MNTRESLKTDLLFYPEIDRTIRRNCKAVTQSILTDSSSTSPSTPPQSPGLGTLLVPPPVIHSYIDIKEEQKSPFDAMGEDLKLLKPSFVPQGVAQPSCITFTPATNTSFSVSP